MSEYNPEEDLTKVKSQEKLELENTIDECAFVLQELDTHLKENLNKEHISIKRETLLRLANHLRAVLPVCSTCYRPSRYCKCNLPY